MPRIWYYCPKCKSLKIRKFSYRFDPATGEKVPRPASLSTSLFAAVPIGLLSSYVLLQSPSSMIAVISVVGLIAAVIIPVHSWGENTAFKQLDEDYEYECHACRYRWPKQRL